MDRPGVLCVKYEGLGTGHAKRVEENKVRGRQLVFVGVTITVIKHHDQD